MEKEKKNGYFYCSKCNSIPLVHLIAKGENIKVFAVCKCQKKLLSYEAFSKAYFQINSKNNLSNIKEIPEEKDVINLEEKIKQYEELREEINKYNLELKNNLIEYYQKKIKEIEKIYEYNYKLNEELDIFLNILINNYKNDNKNTSNSINILNNTNLNKNYKKHLSSFKFENLNNMTFISFEKAAKKYFSNQHILSPDINEFSTLKYLSGHEDSVNCFLEINKDIGVSCSRDSYIIFYDLIQLKQILKFVGHSKGVNFIIKTSNNNLISCGEDSTIKIWPIINVQDYKSNEKKEVEVKPILEIKTEESIKKIIDLNDFKLVVCSHKGIYIYEYKLDETPKFNLIKSLKKDLINDIMLFKNEKEQFFIGYTTKELFVVDYNELKILKEIQCEGPYWQNNIVQINNEEVIYGNNKELYIIDIKKGQIKLKKATTGYINCIFKLSDGSIIRGERDGIKRYAKNTLDELPPLIEPYDDYDDNHSVEQLNYLYELTNGKIILCYRNSNLKIGVLKTG